MDRFDILLQDLKTLFEVRTYIDGKVDMQKSLYFMKELGYNVPFNFRWSKLGPYSYELSNILNRLTLQKYLIYTGRYELDDRHFKYIKPNVTKEMEEFFDGLMRICHKNKLSYIDFIECAASLHFIYKNSDFKEKDLIFKRLALLKPYRIKSFDPLRKDAWEYLKTQKMLNN